MMTPTSSRAMAASPWYHACSSRRKRSPTATTPSEPKTIPGSWVDDAGGSEATNESTPKARNGRGSSACSSRAIDDFPELDAPCRTITALRTPTTVAQVCPRPMASCLPAGPTMTGRIGGEHQFSAGRSSAGTHRVDQATGSLAVASELFDGGRDARLGPRAWTRRGIVTCADRRPTAGPTRRGRLVAAGHLRRGVRGVSCRHRGPRAVCARTPRVDRRIRTRR
jgi:hypothetical protein